jgi:hypothetical protein
MHIQLSEEHLMIQKAARDFAQNELKPGVIERDEHQKFPAEQIKALGELGFMGMMVDPKYGGSGMDTLSYVLVMEELSKIDASTSVAVSVNNSLVCWGLETFGNEEQKQKYLIPLAKGEKLGAFCLSEPEAGSDATSQRTTAVDMGDYYLLNGTKNWTLNYYKDCTVYYGMDFVFFLNVDSAHADDDESHRSTGGWFLFLRKGQGAVAAKSGQTKDVPLSSTESETIWGSNAAMQGAFVKQFLDETRLFKSVSFELHEDSQPMINAQKRNVSQSRFKHMRTKHHYIRKLLFDGWCKLIKIPSKMNTADMATKILPASTVSVFSKIVLGLQDSLLYFTDFDD